jgi:hypothetical protein
MMGELETLNMNEVGDHWHSSYTVPCKASVSLAGLWRKNVSSYKNATRTAFKL